VNLKQALLVLIALHVSIGRAQPFTHSESCGRFGAAVIPLKSTRGTGTSWGTGFIVSSDGWIVTSAHVVIDPDTQQVDSNIQTILPGSNAPSAVILKSPNDPFTRIHDFALLKVDAKNLPFLTLGNEVEIQLGSDMTIIGFPFSTGSGAKFCLAVSVASGQAIATPVGKLDVIYFQGPSVEGISGSPVISQATGEVIGIVNLKLTGITAALKREKAKVADGRTHMQLTLGGVNFFDTVGGILDVLDSQLANGLGAATGAKDAADKLAEAQKQASAAK
jgi:S1-C subfamily serine protease